MDSLVRVLYVLALYGMVQGTTMIALTIYDFKEYKKNGVHKFFQTDERNHSKQNNRRTAQ